jgi:hypothetical protein
LDIDTPKNGENDKQPEFRLRELETNANEPLRKGIATPELTWTATRASLVTLKRFLASPAETGFPYHAVPTQSLVRLRNN